MNRLLLPLLAAFHVLPVHGAETHFHLVVGPDAPFTMYNGGLDTLELRPLLTDYDGDGDFDILASRHDQTGIYLWRNTGTLAAPVFVRETPAALAAVNSIDGCGLCAADVDNDGDGDLFVIGGSAGPQFYRRSGTAAAPVFTEESGPGTPFAGVTSLAETNPAAGDLDGDGDLDIVAGDGNQNHLVLLRNTGTPAAPVFVREAFAPLAGITVTWAPSPALADTDGDGDLDLILGYSDDEDFEHIRCYRNTGTRTAPVFTPDNAPLPFRALSDVLTPTVADLNADGFPDLLCGAQGHGFLLLRGGPPVARRFAENTGASHPVNTAVTRFGHSTADLDGDGDSDLVCGTGTSNAAALTFLRNTGSASAPAWSAWGGAAPAPAVSAVRDVELANVDGGSATDLIVRVHNGVAYVLRYFRNTGTAAVPVFTERTGANNPFNAITGDNSPALADLDGDGDPDLIAGKRYYQNTGSLVTPAFTLRTGAQSPLPDLTWLTNGMVPELADADGDGDFDLVAVSGIIGGPFLLYYENTGSAAAPAFTLRTGADSLFAGLNGADWYADIHMGNWNNDAVSDLMLTITGDPAPAGVRYFTGLRTGPPTYTEWCLAWFGAPPGFIPETDPAADPDGDEVQNLVEFAVNTSPVAVSEIPVTNTRTPAGLLQMAVTVRNNDPVLVDLLANGEGSSDLSTFSGSFPPVVTDPVPGDGYALWTFTDQPPPGANPRRFLRAVFQVN